MRSAFIDLGSFRGDILRRFVSSRFFTPGCELHAFEANPLFGEPQFALYPVGCRVHRVAAWTHDGTLDIYINKDHRKDVQGTSVCREKRTGDLDPDRPVKVPCIDFSAWIRATFAPEDNIFVKSNIEGAEYPLFDAMMRDGSISYIKRLYLRTHWNKIGMPREEHDSFMARLAGVPGLTVLPDYSELVPA